MAELSLKPSEEQIKAIANFLGYGNPAGPVWFVGLEEGLGKMTSEDAEANLTARGSFDPTMDLRDAHLSLRENGEQIDIEKFPPSTQVWQYMSKIMLARRGCEHWCERSLVKNFIQTELGRSNSETFLTELSPIPKRHTNDGSWLERFRRWDCEIESKVRRRMSALGHLLSENGPSKIICYGHGRSNEFAESLGVEWQVVSNCPRVSASHDRRYLLLPFFGQGQMSHSVIEDIIYSGLLR